ncbi:FecR protein [Posidoniimonas corsicana]|uniref:FecR protein n=1 Tax=Posidoniimonas corsicana TaxID=1938618 RepID=A0A5C5V5U9_9BACT|nr:FecR family protein [Posidoniimonas corsicana]TWT33918.1 FecR protein [Posidoniimonas corsicana]
MPPADDPKSFGTLQRLIQAWLDGDISADEMSRLSGMLRESRSARDVFLNAMQIDAELFWRYSAQPEVNTLLSIADDGVAHPLASLTEDQLAIWGDPGFQAVFGQLQGQEQSVHAWMQVYPRIRASVFLCIEDYDAAEGVVGEICKRVNQGRQRPETGLDVTAAKVTRQTLAQQLRSRSGSEARTCLQLVDVLMQADEPCDPAPVYESIESFVPHHVPADVLQMLSLRYLLEAPCEKIAESLGLAPQATYDRLARSRMFVWNLCVQQLDQAMPDDAEAYLSLANGLFDRPQTSHPPARRLARWLQAGPQNRQCFRTFCMLHESLYRQLSLGVLFDELSERKDAAFRRVVETAVDEFEARSRVASHGRSQTRKGVPSVAAIGWGAATAATLLLALTLYFWNGRAEVARTETPSPPPVPTHTPSATPDEPVPPPAPEVAPPPVVGVVSVALGLSADERAPLIKGEPIRKHDRITLDHGFVQLGTTSGGVWVLEAPVAAVIEGENQIYLETGRIVGRNAGHETALVVRTPTTSVYDLGTEFGVSVDADASTLVAVYEGAVELKAAKESDAGLRPPAVSVSAGFQTAVSTDAVAGGKVVPLPHDRGFVRPDELQLRQQAVDGSDDAAEMVAFYELLRIDGLLAYQGFHNATNGESYTIGLAQPGIRPQGSFAFGPKLAKNGAAFGLFDSLSIRDRRAVYLDLDVADGSRLAQAGLLGPDGKVGQRNGEVWISWRSRCDVPADEQLLWAGMSLMFGDERNKQEPLFMGEPASLTSFGIHSNIRKNSSESRIELDIDPSTPGVQPLPRDSLPHTLVACVEIRASGQATAKAWCDVEAAQLASTPPHASFDFDTFQFDRLRFEVASENRSAGCSFDEVIVAASLQSLEAAEEALATAAIPTTAH